MKGLFFIIKKQGTLKAASATPMISNFSFHDILKKKKDLQLLHFIDKQTKCTL